MIVNPAEAISTDFWIKKLQSWLQSRLFPKWGIDPDDEAASAQFIFYPRVYRNPDVTGAGQFVAQTYVGGDNKEYKEVYWDDSLKGVSWFGLGPKIAFDVQQLCQIHLITFADCAKLYNAPGVRCDERLRADYIEIFDAPVLGFSLKSTEIWLQNVLREYPGSRRDDRLIKADMGTVHAFRLNLELRYNPAESCDL